MRAKLLIGTIITMALVAAYGFYADVPMLTAIAMLVAVFASGLF